MSDKNTIIDEDAKALRDFLTDIKCLEPIKDRAERFNLFDVFGFARNEIRHSFFLKWLLDPKENHGLGDLFIRALLAHLVSSEPDRYGNRAFDLLMMDCSDFSVQRETKNIDLFLLSETKGVVVTIENKIGSHEHASTGFDSQLDKYRTYVEESFPMIKTKIYIYLTPQEESPSDSENWQSMSYSTIVKIIEELLEDNKNRLAPDVKVLIQNYIAIIRRDIVEDNELNTLCNEIYKKHRKALDLIYSHSDMGMNPTMRVLTEVLIELSNEGKIEYDPKDRATFHTPTMTEYLPKLSEPNSSWGTNYVYSYWFKIDYEKISLVFEIGAWGVDETTKAKLYGLFKTRHPKNKKEIYKYKRLETYKWVKLDEDDEDEKKEKIRKLIIDDVLKKESSWIKECEAYLNRTTSR